MKEKIKKIRMLFLGFVGNINAWCEERRATQQQVELNAEFARRNFYLRKFLCHLLCAYEKQRGKGNFPPYLDANSIICKLSEKHVSMKEFFFHYLHVPTFHTYQKDKRLLEFMNHTAYPIVLTGILEEYQKNVEKIYKLQVEMQHLYLQAQQLDFDIESERARFDYLNLRYMKLEQEVKKLINVNFELEFLYFYGKNSYLSNDWHKPGKHFFMMKYIEK